MNKLATVRPILPNPASGFMLKIWNTHLKPYLLRQDCFRRRSRLKTWLKANNGAIQVCPIELDLSERDEKCDQVKALTYLYLNDFKQVPVDWRDKEIYFRPTATVLDLERFSNFDEYASAVSKSSRGNDNRSVKRAERLGHQTRVIDPTTYRASIDRIRRSKLMISDGPQLRVQKLGSRAQIMVICPNHKSEAAMALPPRMSAR